MAKAALTVNWANYTAFSPSRKRQLHAMGSLIGANGKCPDWCSVTVGVLPEEFVQDCPKDKVTEIVDLPRIHDTEFRMLPYVKDMMDLSAKHADTDYSWIGISCSDIVYTDDFFTKLEEIGSDRRAVVGRAVNVAPQDQFPTIREDHVDVFFVRRKTWERLEDGYPDMVFGGVWWDVTILGWIDRYKIPCTYIQEGELYHAYHVPTSKACEWNQELIGKFNRCEI